MPPGFALAITLLVGCGQTGAPLAPSLKLPTPVTDLAVARIGDRVNLKWTMPRRTTDKLPLKGPQPVQICRRVGEGPCQIVGTASFPPEKAASYDDPLPADLAVGAPRSLAYSINVLSPRGRSAGASNMAFTAAGAAPPPFLDARAEITANGVLLQWRAAALPEADRKILIERTLLSTPRAIGAGPGDKQKSPFGSTPGLGSGLDKVRTLVVALPPGADSGKALDADAAFDQRYSYRISRVATATLMGRSVDVEGPTSAEIVVDTKDVFPPAAPTGLAAVASPQDGAIDLSWSPNTEPDLAGYAVYRSESGPANSAPTRISAPDKLLDSPAFRDATAQPGREYSYSVVAIDRDGNPSPRSAQIEETLPQQ